jgi:hypothetical protein
VNEWRETPEQLTNKMTANPRFRICLANNHNNGDSRVVDWHIKTVAWKISRQASLLEHPRVREARKKQTPKVK